MAKRMIIMLLFVPLLLTAQSKERDYNLVSVEDDSDETRVKVPGATIVVNHFGDTVTTIYLGNKRRLEIIDSPNDFNPVTGVKLRMVYSSKEKFEGHWGGFSLGYNNFGKNYFTNDVPFYLDLNTGKSIEVGINLFQHDISLQRNKNNIGIVTGLGLTLNNYKFANTQYILHRDRFTGITGYREDTVRLIDKNKLLVRYLTVPLLFEFQIPDGDKNPFYINAGLYGSFKLSSHIKVKYSDNFGDRKQKFRQDLNINTFKYGAMVRIGYRWINMYATCDLSALFQKNQGPEIYPWSIGIMLLSF